MELFKVTAKIMAKNPPTIAIALGAIGMMVDLPKASTIFFVGVLLQLVWLGFRYNPYRA